MMNLYVSKPQKVQAVQWKGNNGASCVAFAPGKVRSAAPEEPEPDGLMLLAGKDGSQGWVPVPVGHWLVCQPGDLSDVWPVEDDYFQSKYEPAHD